MPFEVQVTNSENSDFTTIDEGLYKAHVIGMKAGESSYGPNVKINFVIQSDISGDEYFKEMQVTGMASLKINISQEMETKLYRWYKALTGQVAEEGTNIDLEDMIGKSAIIKIEHKTSKEGRIFSNVTDVTPLPSRRPARKQETEEPEQRPARRTVKPVEEEDLPF